MINRPGDRNTAKAAACAAVFDGDALTYLEEGVRIYCMVVRRWSYL